MRFLHGKAVPWAAFLLAALVIAAASLWLIVPIWLPQKAPAPMYFLRKAPPPQHRFWISTPPMPPR